MGLLYLYLLLEIESKGIETATFRFVAQCLNHLRHRVPRVIMGKVSNICTYREGVEAVWHRLPAKLHAQRVVTCVLDCVVDAERSVAIIFNIDIQVAETNIAR